MAGGVSEVYTLARQWSRRGVGFTIALFIGLHILGISASLGLQLSIALLGLAVGIPHGAIDHLISIPAYPRKRFFLYILGYVLLAIVAGLAISTWNLIAFNLVLIMSGLHFGFGDASFLNEKRESSGGERLPLWYSALYALPAGFLPVILPLTDHRARSALERIRPGLVNWAGSYANLLHLLLFICALLAIALSLIVKNLDLAIDLALLTALSAITPPLVAFATYFGFWHALRHTARLVPLLPDANSAAESGDGKGALLRAVVPGLYAVAGSFLLAGVLMVRSPGRFSSSLLWSVLVIIWALTVPHMASTARLDRRSLLGAFGRFTRN